MAIPGVDLGEGFRASIRIDHPALLMRFFRGEAVADARFSPPTPKFRWRDQAAVGDAEG